LTEMDVEIVRFRNVEGFDHPAPSPSVCPRKLRHITLARGDWRCEEVLRIRQESTAQLGICQSQTATQALDPVGFRPITSRLVFCPSYREDAETSGYSLD
jgi:hypothetical protein